MSATTARVLGAHVCMCECALVVRDRIISIKLLEPPLFHTFSRARYIADGIIIIKKSRYIKKINNTARIYVYNDEAATKSLVPEDMSLFIVVIILFYVILFSFLPARRLIYAADVT